MTPAVLLCTTEKTLNTSGMRVVKNLRIKKADQQWHPNGTLWTHENPYEEEAFKHFTGGSVAVIESLIPELVYVADLHGWTVTRASKENDQ